MGDREKGIYIKVISFLIAHLHSAIQSDAEKTTNNPDF